jgi:hypothetical protein
VAGLQSLELLGIIVIESQAETQEADCGESRPIISQVKSDRVLMSFPQRKESQFQELTSHPRFHNRRSSATYPILF